MITSAAALSFVLWHDFSANSTYFLLTPSPSKSESMPRWRWRVRGRGRPPKHRLVRMGLEGFVFAPLDNSGSPLQTTPIHMRPDEFEALRLVYLEGLNQDEAARMMNISRGTLWRALDSGRRKLVQALVERRPLIISP